MLAYSTFCAQIVGTPKAERAKQRGDLGLALTLIERLLAARASDAATGLRTGCQRAQARDQAGTKLFEQTEHILFEFSQAVLLLLHPRAKRTGECSHTFSYACDQVFCSGGICGRIQVNLLWMRYRRSSRKHYRSTIKGGSPFLTTLACTRHWKRQPLSGYV